MTSLTHVSLFSGVGGLDLAAEWAGFTTLAFCERDSYCQQVLRKHWPDVPIFDDVREVTADALREAGIDRVDLLSGGFPCQPFSFAGQRRGADDERHLWPEMCRIIREVRPRWVLAENVRGLLSIDSGRTFGAILRDLASLGYRVGWCVYGARDVGAPHKRERVFIVAYATGKQSGRVQQPGIQSNVGASGRTVADTDSSRQPQPEGDVGEQWGRVGDGCEDVAHAAGIHAQRLADGPRQVQSWGGSSGPTQPGLGRVFDEFSTRMDRGWPGWPAGPGEEQHSFEPPRVATGVPNREERLKALGNAVVPAQAYPILKAIADTLRRESDAITHAP